jgi:hypothetical protein
MTHAVPGRGQDRRGQPRVRKSGSLPPSLAVVSYLANAQFSPRGIRTRALLGELRREWSVELISGPAPASPATGSSPPARRPLRRALNYIHSSLLLDKYELWSRRRFASWRPSTDGALLIGFPFSPVIYAARRLTAAGIPYVVDIGDPWVLTIAGGRPATQNFGRMRARRAERRLWAGASGAVVTTDMQSSALRSLFPSLPILVRPNGFSPEEDLVRLVEGEHLSSLTESRLRLAHFGDLFAARLDIGPFLRQLARSGVWDEVELHQYGQDWTGTLEAQSEIRAVFHPRRPWSEVIRVAGRYDLALVVGNLDPTTLPSKAISYLQLPIPRLAVVDDDSNDALASYTAARPGWLVLRSDEPDAAQRISNHLKQDWKPAELAPPATESWNHVAREVVAFVARLMRDPA